MKTEGTDENLRVSAPILDQMDEEVAAIRNNAALMHAIMERVEKARREGGTSIAEFKAELGLQ